VFDEGVARYVDQCRRLGTGHKGLFVLFSLCWSRVSVHVLCKQEQFVDVLDEFFNQSDGDHDRYVNEANQQDRSLSSYTLLEPPVEKDATDRTSVHGSENRRVQNRQDIRLQVTKARKGAHRPWWARYCPHFARPRRKVAYVEGHSSTVTMWRSTFPTRVDTETETAIVAHNCRHARMQSRLTRSRQALSQALCDVATGRTAHESRRIAGRTRRPIENESFSSPQVAK